jgi:uncharacterized protein (DUF302 family)
MKKIILTRNVADATDACKQFLMAKGFSIFCDIDHQHNAVQVDLTLPAARTLIFGKPEAGTRLMQQDICAAFDLPLRIAVVENVENRRTSVLILPEARDFVSSYALDEMHPVLKAIDALFSAMTEKLNAEA